jgi:ferredoxin
MTPSSKRLTIDPELCTGHGRCYAVAPDLVDADDEGRGVVTRDDVPPKLAAQARKSVSNCPERAVKLLDS